MCWTWTTCLVSGIVLGLCHPFQTLPTPLSDRWYNNISFTICLRWVAEGDPASACSRVCDCPRTGCPDVVSTSPSWMPRGLQLLGLVRNRSSWKFFLPTEIKAYFLNCRWKRQLHPSVTDADLRQVSKPQACPLSLPPSSYGPTLRWNLPYMCLHSFFTVFFVLIMQQLEYINNDALRLYRGEMPLFKSQRQADQSSKSARLRSKHMSQNT